MKCFKPIERTGDEEPGDLATAEIIDVGIPVAMESLPWIGVFVKGGTVEARQPVWIAGKVRGHPIEDHANSSAVARIDEMREFVRLSESGAGRKLRQGLITPRAAEGVLHDRQQLDMREAEIADIGHELFGKADPVERAGLVVLRPEPGRRMHFVNRDRRVRLLSDG